MKPATLLLAVVPLALAAPIAEADLAGDVKSRQYGSYGEYAPPAGGYGSYGAYGDPNPPATGYGSYGAYPPPAGGYGSYGSYKRAVEWVKKLFG
jgi:hypothetical protein